MNIGSLCSKITNLFKATTVKSVNDSGGMRFYVVSYLGKEQKVMGFSPYGIMHNPPAGSLALSFALQGQESKQICMADDPKNRPLKNLSPGEIAIGNYLTGDYIYIKANGDIETKTSKDLVATVGGDANISTTGDIAVISGGAITATATGAATVSSSVSVSAVAPIINLGPGTLKKLVNALFVSIYNGHTHNETGTITGVPNQQAGASETTVNTGAS